MLQEQQAAAALAQAAYDAQAALGASAPGTTRKSDGIPAVASAGSHGTGRHTGSNKSRRVSPAICASMVGAGEEPKPKGTMLSSSVDSITLTINPGKGSNRDQSLEGDSAPAVADGDSGKDEVGPDQIRAEQLQAGKKGQRNDCPTQETRDD